MTEQEMYDHPIFKLLEKTNQAKETLDAAVHALDTATDALSDDQLMELLDAAKDAVGWDDYDLGVCRNPVADSLKPHELRTWCMYLHRARQERPAIELRWVDDPTEESDTI